MSERLYRVAFETQRNKIYSMWEYVTTAKNQRKAIEMARDQWYANNKAHMFHCRAERINLPDIERHIKPNRFKEVRWQPVTWGNVKQ